MSQEQRLENVNKFIEEIANCGRRFFFNEKNDCYARMEMDDLDRVWLVDDYTRERIYTHYPYRWNGFSHGGTLRSLIEVFRDHIKKNIKLRNTYFDTNDMWCSGHPWGYPHEDYPRLKEAAIRLGIIDQPASPLN